LQTKSEPKEILEKLFGTITVSRVFAVDDTYSPAGSADDIYERSGTEISIVDPKAHGLGYLYPPFDSPIGMA